MNPKSPLELSVVTSLFRSSPFVEAFHRRVSAAARQITGNYEIILVNDGSPDDSLERALAIQRGDPHVIIIDLSRNFGHHQALLTGLEHAQGERIFVLDSDLEEEPEWLIDFLKVMESTGADVVYGVQDRRKGLFFERASGWAFYKLFNALSTTPIPASATIARLVSRRFNEAVLRYDESEVFLPGLWHLPGYVQTSHIVHKKSKGSTSYSLKRKLALFVNALTSFSSLPLTLTFYTGLGISTAASVYIFWLLWRRLFFNIPVEGWSSLIVSIWFLGGLIIFFIGILGIYLAKIFAETKRRPRSVIRQIYPAQKFSKDLVQNEP